MVTLKINDNITLIRVCPSTILHVEEMYVKHTSIKEANYYALISGLDVNEIAGFFN